VTRSSTWLAVTAATSVVAVIAGLDQHTSLSLGLLYLFPIIVVGMAVPRRYVLLFAVVCTWLTAIFNRSSLTLGASLAQDALVFAALAGTGLVAYELTRTRRREVEHREAVEREAAARREAEEQLTFLVNTSPAAILTMADTGEIVAANAAAHRVLGVDDGGLPGRQISRFVPALGRVAARGALAQTFQTEMRCRGERENGTAFPAGVFFSTYTTAQGPRLAAMVIDTSADVVEREESGLEQLMASSRVLVSAMTHEVRNLCGAVAVVHENLARSGKLRGNQDFDALGTLVDALTRIASVQLRHSHQQTRIAEVALFDVLDDLRVVLDPICEDAGIPIEWCVESSEEPPFVSVDQHHLLQALLNLTKNSQRALQNAPIKRLAVTVVEHDEIVSIRVQDSGPGPAVVEHLFQPFQKGAACTGLGLYVSRALVRSFRGDLRYEPDPACTFVVDIPKAKRERARARVSVMSHDSHSITAR
jgi:two-component system, LuxR family, sensor kinase FixL